MAQQRLSAHSGDELETSSARRGFRLRFPADITLRRWPDGVLALLRYSYDHWNTWLALRPLSRATRAIETPGIASTMRRFSSAVR